MKPFELIISVDKEGKGKLTIDGPGKNEVTQGQVITYLAGEIEKYELEITMTNVTKKLFDGLKKQAVPGIQIVKDIPSKFRSKQ